MEILFHRFSQTGKIGIFDAFMNNRLVISVWFGYFANMITMEEIIMVRRNQMIVTYCMDNGNFPFFQFQ